MKTVILPSSVLIECLWQKKKKERKKKRHYYHPWTHYQNYFRFEMEGLGRAAWGLWPRSNPEISGSCYSDGPGPSPETNPRDVRPPALHCGDSAEELPCPPTPWSNSHSHWKQMGTVRLEQTVCADEFVRESILFKMVKLLAGKNEFQIFSA